MKIRKISRVVANGQKPTANALQNKSQEKHNIFFNTHTITGIIISVGLYIIFLCGAFALFMHNIDNWEMNENIQQSSSLTDYERILDEVEAMGYHMHGRNLFIGNSLGPTFVYSAALTDTTLTKSTLGLLPDSVATGIINLELDASTFKQLEKVEDEHDLVHLGSFIYGLHYFEPIPVVGIYLSGIVALFFFFAILTGLIIHWKKIIKTLFNFRLKSSLKNLWADAHTSLGILGLPFQLMYAITGAIFGLALFILMPFGMVLYDGEMERLMEEVYPSVSVKTFPSVRYTEHKSRINALVSESINSIPETERENFQVYIKQYKDENAHLGIVYTAKPHRNSLISMYESTYRLRDGKLVHQTNYGEVQTPTMGVIEFVHQLHFGNYGSYLVKIVYFLMALLTCFMIISGLMIWIKVREKKAFEKDKKLNQRIGRFSIGACMGLFPGLALLFVLTKLMPEGMDVRFPVITYIFGIFWLAYILYSMYLKDYTRMAKHSFFLAGILGIIVPISNGIQSNLWFWRSWGKGLIDSFFIDTAWLIMGLISLYLGLTLQPKPKAEKGDIKEEEIKTEEPRMQPALRPKVDVPEPVLNLNTSSE